MEERMQPPVVLLLPLSVQAIAVEAIVTDMRQSLG